MAVALHTVVVSTLALLTNPAFHTVNRRVHSVSGPSADGNLIGVSSLFEDTIVPDGCAEEDGLATWDNG